MKNLATLPRRTEKQAAIKSKFCRNRLRAPEILLARVRSREQFAPSFIFHTKRRCSSTVPRVTRLGEFSPIGRIFLHMSSFRKNYGCSPKFRVTFSTNQVLCKMLAKMVWATFLAILSQTHSITLTT
jgi:hypothetical protein